MKESATKIQPRTDQKEQLDISVKHNLSSGFKAAQMVSSSNIWKATGIISLQGRNLKVSGSQHDLKVYFIHLLGNLLKGNFKIYFVQYIHTYSRTDNFGVHGAFHEYIAFKNQIQDMSECMFVCCSVMIFFMP